MQYRLTKSFTFDGAHRLPDYDGACARVHGHTWRVDVAVKGTGLEPLMDSGPKNGMLIDFKDLKAVVGPLIARLDHNMLNEIDGLDNPTAENIAAWLFAKIEPLLDANRDSHRAMLDSVTVWESPDSSCTVTR